MEPEPGKYRSDLFKFYVNHHELLNRHYGIDNDKIKRVLDFALNIWFRKVDTRDFKVRIHDAEKQARQFTWDNRAAVYGDVLRVVKELAPARLKGKRVRRKIINFLPNAYSTDQQTILELIPKVNDDELEWLNNTYLDKKDDRRYLLPSAYIHTVKQWLENSSKLPSTLPVLRSLAEDELISAHDRSLAMEVVTVQIDKEDRDWELWLESQLSPAKRRDENINKIQEKANELLICKFKNKEEINWRFVELRRRVKSFIEPKGTHWVGNVEQELMGMSFARPLIDISDDKYLDNHFKLLEFAMYIKSRDKSKKYRSYYEYLVKVVFVYVSRLKGNNKIHPLKELHKELNKYRNIEEANWLEPRFQELVKEYQQALIKGEFKKLEGERKGIEWCDATGDEKSKLLLKEVWNGELNFKEELKNNPYIRYYQEIGFVGKRNLLDYNQKKILLSYDYGLRAKLILELFEKWKNPIKGYFLTQITSDKFSFNADDPDDYLWRFSQFLKDLGVIGEPYSDNTSGDEEAWLADYGELGKEIRESVRKQQDRARGIPCKIHTDEDFRELIDEIFHVRFPEFIKNEGLDKFVHNYKNVKLKIDDLEKRIQKIAGVLLIKNGLLEKGLHDVEIIPEASRKYDNLSVDFKITYPDFKPVCVDYKLASNKEVKYKKDIIKERDKIINQYMGSQSKYGFLVIFRENEDRTEKEILDKLKPYYGDYADRVRIRIIDCLSE